MSLYPSLEDYKVDTMARAEVQAQHQHIAEAQAQQQGFAPGTALYPSLQNYMGLDLSEWSAVHGSLEVRHSASGHPQIAPVTGNAVGLQRAEIRQGMRKVILCKGSDKKLGIRIRSVHNGVFVALVYKNSPASLAGLRFGDQIVEIAGQTTAGWSPEKTCKVFQKCPDNGIELIVRDRPFERTITVHKDSHGHVGFLIKSGAITALVSDSSAARNGMLTEHHVVEIDGQNVVGLKDSEIADIIKHANLTVTFTVMPSFIYNHIVKVMGNSVIRKFMDHSVPNEDF